MLACDVPVAGLVAASGGNHGAAVAYAAQRLGHQAHIFVPELAGASKIDLIKRSGAALSVVPGAYADAFGVAQAHEAETGAMQIHAYDAVPTVTGQGTVMYEWEEQGLEAEGPVDAVHLVELHDGSVGADLFHNEVRRVEEIPGGKEDAYLYHKSSFIFSNLALNNSTSSSFLLRDYDGKIAGVFPLKVMSRNLKKFTNKS